MKKLLAALLFGCCVFAVNAQTMRPPLNFGRYLCEDCVDIINNGQTFPEVYLFIRATQIVPPELIGWVPNDWLTVCNGTSCVDLYYTSSPLMLWMPRAPVYKDSGKGYKNAIGPAAGTGPGGFVGADSTTPGYAYWRLNIGWVSPRSSDLLYGTVTIRDLYGYGPNEGYGAGDYGWDTIPTSYIGAGGCYDGSCPPKTTY